MLMGKNYFTDISKVILLNDNSILRLTRKRILLTKTSGPDEDLVNKAEVVVV